MPATSLVLPPNAAMMQEEEMRYVEGGKTVSKKNCQKHANVMAKVAFYSGVFAAAYCGQGVAALVSAILACGASYAGYVFSQGASHKGLNVTKKGWRFKKCCGLHLSYSQKSGSYIVRYE